MPSGQISLLQFSAFRSSRLSRLYPCPNTGGILCDPLSFYLRITGDLAGIVADPRFSAYPRKHAPFRAGGDGGDLFRHARPCRRCVGLSVIGRADSLVVKSLIIDNDVAEIQAIGRAVLIRSRSSDHVILEIYEGGSCSRHCTELYLSPSCFLVDGQARSINVNFTPAANRAKSVSLLRRKSRCNEFLTFLHFREFRFSAPTRARASVSLT